MTETPAMSKADEARGASKTSALNSNESNPRLLSKKQLAALLGISTRTIDTWLAQKRIPQLRLSNRLTRFSLSKVEAALSRYEVREVGRRQ
jgi:excisionase family DNA binding protein